MVRATDIKITRRPDSLGNVVFRATLVIEGERHVAEEVARVGGEEVETWVREDLARALLGHIFGDLAEPLAILRAVGPLAFGPGHTFEAMQVWMDAWRRIEAVTNGVDPATLGM